MQKKTRLRHIVESRNISMWCIKELYPATSLSKIGRLFNKNHTTVIYSLKSVKELNDVDYNFRTKFEQSYRNVFINCK